MKALVSAAVWTSLALGCDGLILVDEGGDRTGTLGDWEFVLAVHGVWKKQGERVLSTDELGLSKKGALLEASETRKGAIDCIAAHRRIVLIAHAPGNGRLWGRGPSLLDAQNNYGFLDNAWLGQLLLPAGAAASGELLTVVFYACSVGKNIENIAAAANQFVMMHIEQLSGGLQVEGTGLVLQPSFDGDSMFYEDTPATWDIDNHYQPQPNVDAPNGKSSLEAALALEYQQNREELQEVVKRQVDALRVVEKVTPLLQQAMAQLKRPSTEWTTAPQTIDAPPWSGAWCHAKGPISLDDADEEVEGDKEILQDLDDELKALDESARQDGGLAKGWKPSLDSLRGPAQDAERDGRRGALLKGQIGLERRPRGKLMLERRGKKDPPLTPEQIAARKEQARRKLQDSWAEGIEAMARDGCEGLASTDIGAKLLSRNLKVPALQELCDGAGETEVEAARSAAESAGACMERGQELKGKRASVLRRLRTFAEASHAAWIEAVIQLSPKKERVSQEEAEATVLLYLRDVVANLPPKVLPEKVPVERMKWREELFDTLEPPDLKPPVPDWWTKMQNVVIQLCRCTSDAKGALMTLRVLPWDDPEAPVKRRVAKGVKESFL